MYNNADRKRIPMGKPKRGGWGSQSVTISTLDIFFFFLFVSFLVHFFLHSFFNWHKRPAWSDEINDSLSFIAQMKTRVYTYIVNV